VREKYNRRAFSDAVFPDEIARPVGSMISPVRCSALIPSLLDHLIPKPHSPRWWLSTLINGSVASVGEVVGVQSGGFDLSLIWKMQRMP